MARLTFDEIVEQGGLIGQNDAVSNWIGIKLKAWLRKHYAAWPWPFLITQATGVEMVAGTTELMCGGGDGDVVPQISRIFSPIYFRANGYNTRGRAELRTIVGDDYIMAGGQIDPSNQTGAPQSFIAIPTPDVGLEKVVLTPFPIPEKTYTLAFTYQKLPDDCDGDEYPVYPNEMTLIQAAKVAALEYDQTGDAMYQNELRILAEMVAADRAAYGGTPSFGNVMQLDSSIFRP